MGNLSPLLEWERVAVNHRNLVGVSRIRRPGAVERDFLKHGAERNIALVHR